MSALTSADHATLDSLITFLASPQPFFDSPQSARRRRLFSEDHHAGAEHQSVLAVCGNWYDVPHKAAELARAAKRRPHATFLLTGGRAERLTPPEALEVGGEPLLLQSVLHTQYLVEPRRMVVYTGSRITNHNLRAMLMYASSTHSFEKKQVALMIFEEAFLVRREAAALHALLKHPDVRASTRALASVSIKAVGPHTFQGLVETHGGRADLALALVLGEVTRLRAYSRNTTGGDSLVLDPRAAQLDGELAPAVERLMERHRAMLASGKALLSDPGKLWAAGAAPRLLLRSALQGGR
jgi:hypothetical protein